MVRILAIGDSHIPRRIKSIPDEIQDKINELTSRELFDHVLFTGDVIKAPEFINFLKSRSSKGFYRVLGNMDCYGGDSNAPIFQQLKFDIFEGENLIIGLTHGAQIEPRGDHSQLESLAIEKTSHIMISGHTHKEEIFLSRKGILLLNPGSSTGAWSFLSSNIPSFITLKILDNTRSVEVLLYQLDKKTRNVYNTSYNFKFHDKKLVSI